MVSGAVTFRNGLSVRLAVEKRVASVPLRNGTCDLFERQRNAVTFCGGACMSSCCGLVALNVNHNSSELWANSSTHMQSAEVMHEQGPSTGDAAATSADTQNGREEETLASNNEAVATASPDSAHAAAMQCDPEPGLQLKRKIAWLEKELKDARHAQRTLLGEAGTTADCTSKARSATNEWAGPWSKLLSTQGFVLAESLLLRHMDQLNAIADHVKAFFAEDGGGTLFGRPGEAVRFVGLCEHDQPIGEAQRQMGTVTGPTLSFATNQVALRALGVVLNAVRTWVAGGPGGHASQVMRDMHSVKIMDVGFKRVAAVTPASSQQTTSRTKKTKKTNKSAQPQAGLSAQRIHVDLADFQVAEIIIPLSDQFRVTEIPDIPSDLRKCTSRLPLATRRALAARRLAEAGRCAGRVLPNGKETLRLGDIFMIDASQPHGAPGPSQFDRYGLYFNIETANIDQALFYGRFTDEHGVYEHFFEPHPDKPGDAPPRGVRTILQQALDEHPPAARNLRGKKKAWKPREITSKPPLLVKEAMLLNSLYGSIALEHDNDASSTWAKHISAGIAAPWPDLLTKLTKKATWKKQTDGSWTPVYHTSESDTQSLVQPGPNLLARPGAVPMKDVMRKACEAHMDQVLDELHD